MTFDECVSELKNLRSSCTAASTFIKNPSYIIQIVKILLGIENFENLTKIYKPKRERKLYLNDENMIETKYKPVIFVEKPEFDVAYEQFYTK